MTSGTSWHALRRALYQLGVIPGAGRHPCLYRGNRVLYLLVRHGFNPAGCSSFISLGTKSAQIFM